MNASSDRLDSETHARILAQEISTDKLLHKLSHEHPKAIILGGQPGAGKGSLADVAKDQFQGDVVIIDPDALRDYHPNVESFRSTNPYTWSGRTHADASRWADELREAVVAEKKNFIFDTTLSNGPWTTDLIKDLQAKGYEIEVRVVAAHKLESELGVDQRFSRSLDAKGNARYVPEAARDAIYNKVPANLDIIHAQTDVPIRIFNREGTELYDSRHDARSPGSVLEESREAHLKDTRITRELSQGWREQRYWHETLPDTIKANPKVMPATAQHLLVERSELQVLQSVQRDAARAASLDYAVRIHPTVVKSAGALGTAAMAYDAYTTAGQYVALSAQGNTFGADALLHRYEGRTAGGVLGGFGAGVAYGAAAGSETGPGALITGAVGGVIGAFAGDKIATLVNEHQVNHQTGADGVTYAYENGQWGRTQHRMDPGSTGSANPYGAGSYTATTTPAPTDQLAQLDYQRTSAITALALANPSVQDTQHITLDRTEWHATREGWAQSVEMPGVPNAYGIPSTIAVDQPADAKTSEALNQIAANRQYNNDHYAEQVSQAYVMDYVGKGWSANGPLPEAVTHALKLPSEQHLADPATGTVWAATGKGGFERSVTTMAYMTPVTETVKPHAEENSRLVPQQEAAAQANAAYGQQLIAQHYAQMQAMHAQRQAQQETRDAAREAGHAEPSCAAPPPQPHAPATHAALPAAAPTLSPPLDPPGLRDFRHAAHPLHERYQMFRDALGEQGFHQDRPTLNEAPAVRGYSADQKDRLAAGFTAQVSTDNRYSTEIQNFRQDGDALLAIEHPQELGSRPLILAIPEARSLARSPEQHAAAWRARELPEPQAVNTARPDPRRLALDHPGHPDHAHHRMFEDARAALTDEYARWGMQKGADTLDRETVQVMMGARAQRMDDVLTIRLLKDSPNGRIGEHPKLAVYETPEGPRETFRRVAIIESPSLQHAPPVAQSAEQFQKVDQKVTEQIQTEQQRQAEINAQGPQGPHGPGPRPSPGGPGL